MEVHKSRNIPRSVFNFNRADMDGLRRDIGKIVLHHWNTVEDKWYHLKNKIMKSLDNHVPRTRITNKKSPPWIDQDVTQMSKRKHDALIKSIKTKSTVDRDHYKSIRNRLKNLVSSKYREFLYNISENMITQPKKFWNLLASRTKNKSTPNRSRS